MDTNKKFEDQLRERLHGGELPFDPAAWDSFQEKYTEATVPVETKRKKLLGGWLTLLVFCCLGAVAAFLFQDIDTQVESGQNSSLISSNDTPIVAAKSEEVTVILDRDDMHSIDEMQVNEREFVSAEVETFSVGSPITNERQDQTVVRQDSAAKAGESITKSTVPSKEIVVDGIDVTNGGTVLTTSEVQDATSQPASVSSLDISVSDIGVLDDGGTGGGKGMMDGGDDRSPRAASQIEGTPESKEVDTKLDKKLLAGDRKQLPIALSKVSGLTLESVSSIASPAVKVEEVTVPHRYRRNALLVGMGYSFRQGMSDAEIKNVGIDGSEPNVLQIMYERRIDKNWSIGTGAAFRGLRSLGVERTTSDYHLTSTSFEFIEIVSRHKRTAFLEVPLYINYNPLGKRYSLFVGAAYSYALAHEISATTINNGTTNSVIEQIREERNYDQYLQNHDLAVFAGARYRFWRRLEFEVRASYGLTDIAMNSFWGNSDERSSSVSAGINYKLNW